MRPRVAHTVHYGTAVEEVVAYSTLGLTVSLAVMRPRVGWSQIRFTPGSAALFGVTVLLLTGLLTPAQLLTSARIQWRPLLALTCIMIMTGVVQEVGAFDRLASWIETRARSRSAVHTFTVVFVLALVTPSLLNNDAAIMILTPLVIALTRRLYPGNPKATLAFAFVVFLAPGVAPFIVSNPMNMIVAEFAGLDFNGYAIVMVPISLAGAALTYCLLRAIFRRVLATTVPSTAPVTRMHRHRGERPAVILMLVVFFAYPVAAMLGAQIWFVSVGGAIGALVISQVYNVAPVRKVTTHVSPDILIFLWGIFLVVQGLRSVGVVDALACVYQAVPAGGGHLAVIGTTSAVASALVDNHPMSILNMMAIDGGHGTRSLLAALVGGDIGPRLLPIGSLAGLLWMDLLRRAGVDIGIGKFVRVGTLVLLPTLALSLLMLWVL
jgi:arsenical pump membrane protein